MAGNDLGLQEGAIEEGNIVIVAETVGKVTKIGSRTGEPETHDDIMIIVLNSKMITDKVNNWSHNKTPTCL